jgi:archaellum component FlaD/FlaE
LYDEKDIKELKLKVRAPQVTTAPVEQEQRGDQAERTVIKQGEVVSETTPTPPPPPPEMSAVDWVDTLKADTAGVEEAEGKERYYVDPTVIKRIQWRLSRIEDFEASIGAAIQEIKESIAKLELTRAELDEMRKGYVTVERTMHELAALYDLISSNINPFVDAAEEQKAISAKIMKRSMGITAAAMPEYKTEETYSPDTWTVKWAEYLLERIPKKKIPALLEHYIDIGWLDDETKEKVENCIKGISEIDLGIKAHEAEEEVPEGEEAKKPDWWKLPIDTHVKSLRFIEKIRGIKVGDLGKLIEKVEMKVPTEPTRAKRKERAERARGGR